MKKTSKFAMGVLALALLSATPVLAAGDVQPEYMGETESNNTTSSADQLIPFNTMIGKIAAYGDVDYFYYQNTSPSSQTILVKLSNIPYGKDYNLYVYNQSNLLVASSTSTTSLTEQCKLTIPAGQVYFIKVAGSIFSYDSQNAYYLDLTF